MGERGPARGRASVWPTGRSRHRALARPVPENLVALSRAAAARLHDWLQAETAPGRLLAWIAVAFALGIMLYFAAGREPALWAASAAAAGALLAAITMRERGHALALAMLFAAVASGFFVATWRAYRLDHPILQRTVYSASLSGFVEKREERERSDRIVVRVHAFDAARTKEKLQRVRVAVRKGTAPPVGVFVAMKARLSPPFAPLRPGGYDFARDLYFHGIGAVGFALGKVRPAPAPASVAPGARLQAAATIAEMREGIDRRIRAALSGDTRAIATALITGKRDAISHEVSEAMYVSSIGHVLSISGYHMAIVAGVVFVFLRAGLALVPGLAEHRPIKKWAAGGALLAAAFYLVLSGAAVETQRAFIMAAVVLIGVMLDRQAITMRTLALAALAVMIATPEALVHPSFQMSFAATLALVAAYERGLPWVAAGGQTSLGARVALWGGREVFALVFVSLVAGFATTLFVAYHFHRLAPYGVLANLLAMPIVSGFVMPVGLIALVALPFGFDDPLWHLMGIGIDWMTGIAVWVAGLPGAVGRITAFGLAPLLLATLGLVVICLLRTPLRWSGAVMIIVAAALAAATPRPDVLVSGNGDAVAVRGADGRLSVMKTGRRRAFALRYWLAADGDARSADDATLGAGFSCDPAGCIAKLADGAIVAVARSAEAFADDCARAALIIAARDPPADCAATVIERNALRRSGALALRRVGQGWEITAARARNLDRPWARATPEGRSETRSTPSRAATPRTTRPVAVP